MIKSLEGMRGLAALIVALYHLGIGVEFVPFIRNGYLFVDLFFVLSGFIMCAAYADHLSKLDDLRIFLVRRIGRLLPLLVFSTVAYLAIANAIVLAKRVLLARGDSELIQNPDALAWIVPQFSEIITTLTFTHSLGVFDRLILNTPSWSISVEFYAYVLFAVLCLFLSAGARLYAFAIAAIIAFAITIWASVTVHDCLVRQGCMSLTYDFGFARAVCSFFIGALTWYASRHSSLSRIDARWWQRITLVMLAFVFYFVDRSPLLAFTLPFLFAILILACCEDRGPMAVAMRPKPLQYLGLWSYSIYLMHMPLLLVFGNLADRSQSVWGSFAIALSFVALLLAISALTYRYIEEPARAWFNRISGRRVVYRKTSHV